MVIGSSTCEASNSASLPRWVASVEARLESIADSSGLGFATLGISKDHSVSAGIDHLERLGSFDEVAIGRGWLNSLMVRYIWDELPGRAARG